MCDIAGRAAGMTDRQIGELWLRCRIRVAMIQGPATDKIYGPDEVNHPEALRLFLGALAKEGGLSL